MCTRSSKRWSAELLPLILAVSAMAFGIVCEAVRPKTPNKFETIRVYIQDWLSATGSDRRTISSSYLKEMLVDNWGDQKAKYQLVSVRKPEDFNSAGHIPNAINIYWTDILNDENLARLDSTKTIVLYCYYGHASMLSSTILGLLGYRCQSLSFGMMGWNLHALVKQPWDQQANYEVEAGIDRSKETYPPPVVESQETNARSIIKEMARRYLSGEGSPVIASADVKAIVDDWNRRKVGFQVVDVRSRRDYEAGHVPHSINVPWARVVQIENLEKLDPNRTMIVYSENGQMGQMATTVLSLLGYHAVAMKFGMMDWNKAQVDQSDQWTGAAGYPVER